MRLRLILVIILLIALIFFLYFIYKSNPEIEPKSIKQFSIAIFVDENAYSELSSEIHRLKSDIIHDLTTKIQNIDVYVFYDWDSKEEIKNKIINLWEKENLTGVILIGDIPTYIFLSEYYSNGIPSDFYYMDVENTCKYPTIEDCTIHPRIWLGRITPPIKGNHGLELIKKYLNKNHNYRTSMLSFNRDILFFLPSEDITDVEERGLDIHEDSIYPNLRRVLIDRSLDYREIYKFSPNNVIIFEPTRDYKKIKDEYFNALQKPYEIVYLNGHGSPNYHSPAINYEEIKNIEPQPMYYIFSSCSVGKFTEENYMAGWYLFSGNGLVAEAVTEVIMGSFPPSSEFTRNFDLLTKGEIFGNVDISGIQYSPIRTFLGDPTLRLRYDKIKSDAKLVISKEILKFGDVKAGSEKILNFTIYNKGSEDLFVDVPDATRVLKEPEIPVKEDVWIHRYLIECDWKTWGKIEPYSSVLCQFVFFPPIEGKYEYILDIYSNDKDNYWIRMPIIGEGT